ncbi:putative DsbA oxidoreductase [uncultured Desulfatiglans sp.]|uniref:Putative DsbA oxidoreductase n=1 Tax=Uncultured Desulfatiglans sp. TaxID=1748965 RepID=A0A653A5B2_UNCDX|nr:putative DsbA oxidoreductase [uncultured Desulfatiglans sp.]
MNRFFLAGWLMVLLSALCVPAGAAGLEWEVRDDGKLEVEPLDLAVAQDGSWMFVLAPGEIRVLDAKTGASVARIPIESGFDRIVYSESEQTLILTSRGTRRQLRVALEKVYSFDLSGLPILGAEDGAVTVTVFSDYQCPYCARLEPLLQQVQEKYPEEVGIVHKNLPLSSHRFAVPAALAALAANAQGRFEPFHKALMASYSTMSEEVITRTAEAVGLDMERFQSDRKNPAFQGVLRRDMEEGRQAGVRGIPAVFVNGKPLRTLTPEKLMAAVEKERQKTSR